MFRLFDDFFRGALPIVGQAAGRKRVDEMLHRIDLPAHLADCIVKGEDVVIVVEAFAPSRVRDPHVLARLHLVVVGPIAEHVRRRVDEPSAVQSHDVPAERAGNERAEPRVAD